MNAFAQHRNRAGRSGMTLIEIIIGIMIATIILAAAYASYSAAVQGWNAERRRSDMRMRGRVALDLMGRCLMGAQIPDTATDAVFIGFNGIVENVTTEGDASEYGADMLTFRTNSPIFLFGNKEIPDQAEIQFLLEPMPDPATGEPLLNGMQMLTMRIDDTYDTDPETGGWLVEVAQGVLSFEARYFDGTEWIEEWPAGSGPPKAVEVGIVIADLDEKESPMTSTRLISLAAFRSPPPDEAATGEEGSSFEAVRGQNQDAQRSQQNAQNAQNAQNQAGAAR